MVRRKKNVLDSDEDSDTGSESADSTSTVKVNNSRPAPKKKLTARKRGRPPVTTKKKAKKLQDDSDDDGSSSTNTPQNVNNDQSEDENNSSDSDYTVDNSKPAPKKKATARKRGRPPATTKKKAQKPQDDSDAGGSSPSNTSQNVNNDQSEDETNSSDSDYVADSTNRTKRKPGRPSLTNSKKQKLQNGTLRDSSPQPSTSYQTQNGIDQNAEESESESDSNSADSDLGMFNERSFVQKKKRTAKQQSQRITNKKTATNTSSSNKSSVNSSQLDGSHKKNSKLSQSYDASLDSDIVERLAHELVYFLLIEDQKKYAIRRKGIVTHVFKDDYTPKRYVAVIKKANVILKKIYGMELMELENQKDSYLIVNILRRELGIHEYVEISRPKQPQHGLILYLLTVIYMNENVITEDELTRCLRPLGIDLTSKRLHPVFGDVKKYITTELVKQMYLNYECLSKEPPKYEFTWGLRAKQEFDKRDLLQFACMIIDDTSPEDWRIQFRDAESSAKPNADS